MAREDKRVQLKTIDEVEEPTTVVRLANRETVWKEKEGKAVRLGVVASVEAEVSQRLDLPAKEEIELRTHQPTIDELIDPGTISPDQLEKNWGEAAVRRYPIPWGWFALIGLAILSAVIWSLTQMQKADVPADQIRIETKTVLEDEERQVLEAQELIDRIDRLLRSYFSATSVESLARMVRHKERVEPLMHQYYADKPAFSGSLKSLKSLQPLTLGNRGNFWMASVQLVGGSTRSLLIEIDPSGQPKIDWETLVCYQPMKWDDFVTQRPPGKSLDFRVYAERDTFHSHEFSDSDLWVCFRLTALDSDETLFGYAPADSAEAQDLLNLCNSGDGQRTSVILRLSIPEGLQSRRGVVIEKMLSSRWLFIDPPDSGS